MCSLIAGVKNFSNDVKFMLGSPPSIIFRVSWVLISPLVLLVLIVYYFVEWTPIKYNNIEPYPAWADYVGLIFAALSVLQIPVIAALVVFKKKVRTPNSLSTFEGLMKTRKLKKCSSLYATSAKKGTKNV